MGWLFLYACGTRNSLIEHLIKDEEWEVPDKEGKPTGVKATQKCIAHCYRGAAWQGVLYAVFERSVSNQDGSKVSSRHLVIFLLDYSRHAHHCWGYKDMDETFGPYVCGCPVSYLDMVPCPDSESARNWRERVRARAATTASKARATRALRSSRKEICRGLGLTGIVP